MKLFNPPILSLLVMHTQVRHQLLVLVELCAARLALETFLLLAAFVVRPPMAPQVRRMRKASVAERTADRPLQRVRPLVGLHHFLGAEPRSALVASDRPFARMDEHVHRQRRLFQRPVAAHVAFETSRRLQVPFGMRFHCRGRVEDATASEARRCVATPFRMFDVRVNVPLGVRSECGSTVDTRYAPLHVRMGGEHVIDQVVGRARVAAVSACDGRQRWR